MSDLHQHARDTFGPLCFKTFEGALNAFIAAECPQLGGLLTRKAFVQAIAQLVTAHYPSTTHMGQGQVRWTAVHKDEKSSYGKTIAQSQLTPVVLDLVPSSEVQARAEGTKLREVKIEAVARLLTQAYEQSGVLTNAEVSLLLKLSPSTGGTHRREWEEQHQRMLPTRGSIHDMGSTLTHKKIILQQLIFEGKNVQTVCREPTAGRSPATGCPKGERSEANGLQPRGRAALHRQLQAGALVQKQRTRRRTDQLCHQAQPPVDRRTPRAHRRVSPALRQSPQWRILPSGGHHQKARRRHQPKPQQHPLDPMSR